MHHAVGKMVEQCRIASYMRGSCLLCYHIYKKIQTATAGKIFIVLTRLAIMFWTVVQYESDDNIVGHLPTESIRGLFPFSYMQWLNLFAHKIARTSRSHYCSAKQESVQHLQQWPHGYWIKIVTNKIIGRIKDLAIPIFDGFNFRNFPHSQKLNTREKTGSTVINLVVHVCTTFENLSLCMM